MLLQSRTLRLYFKHHRPRQYEVSAILQTMDNIGEETLTLQEDFPYGKPNYISI